MAGIFDFLTQAQAPATAVTSNTSTLPAWYEDYQRNLLSAGISTAAEPFQAYPYQRLADLTPTQREAISGAKTYGQTMAPLSTIGAEAMTRAGAEFTPEAMQEFMSPYTMEVADIIGQRGMQRWEEQILPSLMDPFTAGGQFGSKRAMEFAGRAARDIQQEIAREQTEALERGYGTALSGYGAARAADLAAAQAAAGLARGGLDVLGGAGAMEQADIEKSLELAYKDFLEQREYPWTQLERLKGLGAGISVPTSTTSTQPFGGAGLSPLQILAGIYAMTQ